MNTFFKPSPIYKEYLILNLLNKDNQITQRGISDQIGIALSMVNKYLSEYEDLGYLEKNFINEKNVQYKVTHSGYERMQALNIAFLSASNEVYNNAKDNVLSALLDALDSSSINIILYGAGEVAEIILSVLKNEEEHKYNVVAVIDDDENKIGTMIQNVKIVALSDLDGFEFDSILISSYKHQKEILGKIKNKVNKDKIRKYFS